LNDFKSDRRVIARWACASLPVQLGVQGAARTACVTMAGAAGGGDRADAARLGRALACAGDDGVLMAAQAVLMRYFLAQPQRTRALMYSGFGVPLFVAGMMVSAFALRVAGS
jgi:chlorophyll/bacteriochlorophyll a synthase